MLASLLPATKRSSLEQVWPTILLSRASKLWLNQNQPTSVWAFPFSKSLPALITIKKALSCLPEDTAVLVEEFIPRPNTVSSFWTGVVSLSSFVSLLMLSVMANHHSSKISRSRKMPIIARPLTTALWKSLS